jgi:hypothetical protein
MLRRVVLIRAIRRNIPEGSILHEDFTLFTLQFTFNHKELENGALGFGTSVLDSRVLRAEYAACG